MNITLIIISVAVVSILGLSLGLFLGISAKKLAVETDPREDKIIEALPGANCGGCGYAGCSACAAAIVKGEAKISACPVGGDDVAQKVGEIMGIEAGDTVKMRAFVKCNGTCENAKEDYEYTGVKDCSMVSFVPGGGSKSCNYGCLGFGNCAKACPFDAISIINGVAVVDKDRCKACGQCVAACPKHIIEMIPYNSRFAVTCNSNERGADAMKKCNVTCIGCGICKKNCPATAITVEENLAKIDQSLCEKCGVCKEKCPKKAINKI